MLEQIKELLAITLTATLGQLGPMPDFEGEEVKKILQEEDSIALLALGCYLDECREKGSYDPLVTGIGDIREHQKEQQRKGTRR